MKQNFFVMLLCTALISLYTYTSLENKPVRIITPEKPVVTVDLKAITDSIDGQYHLKLSRLESKNDSLQLVIGYDKQSLVFSKRKASYLQQKVQLLSQQLTLTPDTTEKIELCDSLQEEVSALITESTIRDSLCDKTIQELTELSYVQDASLDECKKSYLLIKQNLGASLLQQEQLSGQLSLSEKKLRRRTTLNRWLAGGLAIAGGVITTTVLLN